MKWLSPLSLSLVLLIGLAHADEPAADKLVECPACGVWQTSFGTAPGMAGEIIVIDGARLIIPSCGIFDYVTAKSQVVTPQDSTRNAHDIALLLTMQRGSVLCSVDDDTSWRLEVSVYAHSGGGGVADFTLKRGRGDLLSFQAWNMNRDDPCDAASARGSGACAMISKGLVYKALAAEAKAAYELATVIATPGNKHPSFNVGRFAATVARFCEHREKDSGAGAWPFAWAQACEREILAGKLTEISASNACTRARLSGTNTGAQTKSKLGPCPFPNEAFDRTTSSLAE
jgi:hypothetical protein